MWIVLSLLGSIFIGLGAFLCATGGHDDGAGMILRVWNPNDTSAIRRYESSRWRVLTGFCAVIVGAVFFLWAGMWIGGDVARHTLDAISTQK